MKADANRWQNLNNLNPRNFVCGFCGKEVGSDRGYFSHEYNQWIYICPTCGQPNYFVGVNQYPAPMIGKQINRLPKDINSIYNEMRHSLQDGLYTATLLLGRKLIMHLAVDKAGAKESESFVAYVNHLKTSGYIPPNAIKWVEKIKDLGNEKNHELKIGSLDEAKSVLEFVELLLLFMYEYADEIKPEA